MQRLISLLFPPDPPFSPMTFSRLPVVHRFWGGGVVAGLVGFSLGFLLWLWMLGILELPEGYQDFRMWHARIQILMFLGSFLLGFALQSGPHVVGGTPPPSRTLLWLLPLLWVGLLVTFIPHDGVQSVGNLLISMAYGGAAYFLWQITMKGDPLRRLSRGIPLAASFVPLAMAPWLPLEQAETALLVLWCGPVTSALVAGQQLINNVLGGTLLQGRMAYLFSAVLLLAWVLSGAAVWTSWASWSLAGFAWLVVICVMLVGTGFLPVARRFGFSAINVTLIVGFSLASACAILLLYSGESFPLDAAVHLLGAGMMTILVLGVGARVVGFFSAQAVLNDRLVAYLLLLWSAVAITRTVAPLGWVDGDWAQIMTAIGMLIVVLWSFRVSARLWHIDKQLPPEIGGRYQMNEQEAEGEQDQQQG